MKKGLHLLATAALMAAGAMNANADRFYSYTDQVDAYSFEPGVKYALNSGQAEFGNVSVGNSVAFLSGTAFNFTNNLTLDCLFTFEEAGTNSKGDAVYYLKNNAGEYFAKPGRPLGYTTNLDYAWKVTVKAAETYESEYEYSNDDDDYSGIEAYVQEAKDNDELFDFTNATFLEVTDGVVICDAEAIDADDPYSEYNYLLGAPSGATTSSSAARGTNYNRNVWVIYEVEQQSGSEYLQAILNQYFPDGFNPDDYSTGINPGDYDADALDALTEIYEIADAGVDDEEAEKVAEQLIAAYEAFKSSFKNFGPGYYIFTTFRSPQGALFDNTDNVSGAKANMYTYTDPAVAITHTQVDGKQFSVGDWDVYQPESEDPDNEWISTPLAPYIVWQVIETDTPGMYYVQNYQTKQYIGGAPKNANGTLKPSNAPILLTKTPEAKYNMAPTNNKNSEGVLCWMFYSDELTKVSAWGGGWEMGGLHAPGDVLNMVTWNAETDGSCWVPRTVTPEMLKAIDEAKVQPMLNNELKHLVEDVEEFIDGTKSYKIFDLATGKPAEGLNEFENLDVDGLVTDPSQLSSNAAETNEGPIEGLVDGDIDSFFHTAWSADAGANVEKFEVEDPETGEMVEKYVDHNLMMDLLAPYQQLTFKWLTRGNGSINGRPVDVKVFASNDGSDWTEVCEGTFSYYGTKIKVAGEQKNSYVGVLSVDLGAKYRYVRFDVKQDKLNDGKYGRWFNGAEFRVYEGLKYEYKYDEGSVYESIPQEDKDAVAALVEQAKEELEDGLATRETIDALKAAFETLKSHTPDPQILRDLADKAQALHDAAVAGTTPGYFAQADIDAFQVAIDAAKAEGAKTTMTVEEVQTAIAALNAAIDAFQAALIKPAKGWYAIKSKSSNASNEGTRICAMNAASNWRVDKNGRVDSKQKDDEGNVIYADDPNADMYLGSYWYVEKGSNGYTFKNLYTGLYLAPEGPETEQVVQSEAPYEFALQFAQEPGCFNFVLAKEDAKNESYIYVNAQPGGGVVTWTSAEGRDNSAWEFVAASESEINDVIENSGMKFDLEYANAPMVATFPVAMSIETEDVKFYTVLCQNDNNDIQLEEATKVEAGQAYVIIPQVETKSVTLFTEAYSISELQPTNKAAEAVNGLYPAVDRLIAPKGAGIFIEKNTKLSFSEGANEDAVAAGTGYFSQVPVGNSTGAASIKAAGKFDGIANIIVSQDTAKGIYSISGVRMSNLNNLPAGLYIINGKKYIVK